MAKKMCGEERLVAVERVHWWNWKPSGCGEGTLVEPWKPTHLTYM